MSKITLQLGDIKHIDIEAIALLDEVPSVVKDEKGRVVIKASTFWEGISNNLKPQDSERIILDLKLSSFYQQALKTCVIHGIKKIAFPAITLSNIDTKQAAIVAIESVKEFLTKDSSVEKVVFCCYFTKDYTSYNTVLNPGLLSKYIINL